MNDLISRQAAIDTLCSVCTVDCDKNEFVYGGKQEEQVILCPEHYVLSTLPSAQPKPQWIPCSERLPEKDGCYLVTITGTNYYIIDIAYYDSRWHKASRVIAWMPLPKYEEED